MSRLGRHSFDHEAARGLAYGWALGFSSPVYKHGVQGGHMSAANDPVSGTPDADSPGIMDAGTDLLGAAIDRATQALWSARRADGSCDERSDIGPAGTANVLVSLNHAGVLPSRDLTAGTSWLRAHQRLDGSFVPYPFAADGSLSATAQCWAALHLDGASAGAARKAEDYVRSHGGIPQLLANMGSGDLAPIYLALAGLLDPRRLPCPPIVWALSDPVVSFASRRVHFGIVIGALQLSLIVRSLRGRRATGLILRRAYQRAVERMTLFQNSDGSWNSNTVQTALARLDSGSAARDPSAVSKQSPPGCAAHVLSPFASR